MIIARDSFIDYITTSLAATMPVKVLQNHSDNMEMEALNIKFLNDTQLIGTYPKGISDILVSLDICTRGDKENSAERKAISWAESLLTILNIGCIKIENSLQVAWSTFDTIIRDIPQESYIHKNLTLTIKSLIN